MPGEATGLADSTSCLSRILCQEIKSCKCELEVILKELADARFRDREVAVELSTCLADKVAAEKKASDVEERSRSSRESILLLEKQEAVAAAVFAQKDAQLSMLSQWEVLQGQQTQLLHKLQEEADEHKKKLSKSILDTANAEHHASKLVAEVDRLRRGLAETKAARDKEAADTSAIVTRAKSTASTAVAEQQQMCLEVEKLRKDLGKAQFRLAEVEREKALFLRGAKQVSTKELVRASEAAECQSTGAVELNGGPCRADAQAGCPETRDPGEVPGKADMRQPTEQQIASSSCCRAVAETACLEEPCGDRVTGAGAAQIAEEGRQLVEGAGVNVKSAGEGGPVQVARHEHEGAEALAEMVVRCESELVASRSLRASVDKVCAPSASTPKRSMDTSIVQLVVQHMPITSTPTDHPLKSRRLRTDAEPTSLPSGKCNDCGQAGQMFLDPSDNMHYCQRCWVHFYGLHPIVRDGTLALGTAPRGTQPPSEKRVAGAMQATRSEVIVTEHSTELALAAVRDRMAVVQEWLLCKHCGAKWPPGAVKKYGFQNMRSVCKLHGKKCRDSEKYRDAWRRCSRR